MKKLLVTLLLSLVCFSLFACTKKEDKSKEKEIDEMIEKMTLEEKVSQMIMICCRSREGVNFTQMTPEIAELLSEYSFNGFILYAQNIVNNSQTYDLIKSIQDASSKSGRPGLLIAVDQEGGRVVRLEEGTNTPGNMALGAIDDLDITKNVAKLIASEIKALGFNTDFAPVVDVNNNPNNPVIGVRSFSDDKNIVTKQTKAFIEGFKSENIIGSLKHFPGHGDTGTDSHTGLPLIDKSLKELKETELVPYINNINDIEMFMTAHILYPQIEKETYISKLNGEEITLPATLSKTILTDILRNDLGFNGVVITDAMEMAAIESHFKKEDSARLAINAGVDIILMPVDISTATGIQELKDYIANIVSQVNSGAISIDNINASVKRILTLKANHDLLDGYKAPDKSEISSVGSIEHHDYEMEVTLKAITLVKNYNALPLTKEDKVLIITTNDSQSIPVNYALSLASAEATVVSLANVNLDTLATLVTDYNKVVIFSEMSSKAYLTNANATKIDSIIALLNALNKKSIVLSTNLPYDASRFTNASAFVICYSSKGMSEDPRQADGNIKQYGPNIPAAIYLMYEAGKSVNFTAKLPIEIRKINASNEFTDEVLYNRGFGLQINN